MTTTLSTPSPHDPLARLTAAAPTAEDLREAWPAEQSDAVWQRLRLGEGAAAPTREPPPAAHRWSRGSRRAWALGVAASVLAGGLVLAPQLVGGAESPAAALDRLAHAAARNTTGPIPSDKVLHVTVVETQTSSPAVTTAQRVPDETRTTESQITADGIQWSRQVVAGAARTWKLDLRTSLTSPSAVAALPADVDSLRDWLRVHSSGSNSPNEAVFEGAVSVLRTGYARPDVARSAVQVLAQLPEVTTSPTTLPGGHDGLRVEFADDATRPGSHAVVFDTTTAQVVRESVMSPDGTLDVRIGPDELVDEVPSDVQGRALDPAADKG